jgi:hypothetical protein
MSRIYFQYKVLLSHLFYTRNYCKLYLSVLAIKIVVKFIFQHILLILFYMKPLSTVARPEYFQYLLFYLCSFSLFKLFYVC